MSEAKHTPGPWSDEVEANASLIATSPELLDFVKQQWAETNCICHFKSAGLTTLACTKCDAAALIARAEGRNA